MGNTDNGLVLTNCENGQQFEFKDPDWKLPFSMEDLYWKCQDVPVGYVGVVISKSETSSFCSMNRMLPDFVRIDVIEKVLV